MSGQWNPQIFRPGWVGRRLLDAKEVKLQASFPSGRLTFSAHGVSVSPSTSRLVVGVEDTKGATLRRAEQAACRALELLEHTPIQGMGINFGFRVDQPPASLTHLFRKLSDEESFTESGKPVLRTEIHHAIRWEPSILNIRLVQDSDEKLEIHLNFHHDVDSADSARSALNFGFSTFLAKSTDLLKQVYGLGVDLARINGDEQ